MKVSLSKKILTYGILIEALYFEPDDVINSNKSAWEAGIKHNPEGNPKNYVIHDLHALQWLCYGYLQKQQYQSAYQLVKTMQSVAAQGSVMQDLRFPGQVEDKESHLVYNNAREYVPHLGRYLQPDPLGLGGGSLNPYTYADNNPVNVTDPTGKNLALRALLVALRMAESVIIKAEAPAASAAARTAINNYNPKTLPQQVAKITQADKEGQVCPWAENNNAHNAVDALRLNKSLASEAQMGEDGHIFTTEPGTQGMFRDAPRFVAKEGGELGDWVKKSSSQYMSQDGNSFETHWVENTKTGQRFEYKTEFPKGNRGK